MNRRIFGQLLVGASALGLTDKSPAKAKTVKSDVSAEMKREQVHLADLQDWLSSAQANPYSAVYVPGIKELISLSEARLHRLHSSV
ncbi:MAG: hypothetical protein AAFO87_17425 [Cyanobacteria bacterium J06607_6]